MTTRPSWWGSPERFAQRKKLRKVADSVAEQTGRDTDDVCRVLVTAEARERLADRPGAVSGAVEFEMDLHHSDQLREITGKALEILEAD